MDLGDLVLVDHPRHPLNGCQGKVVGRRGLRAPDDLWMLVYVPSRMRSFLIPRSMLKMEQQDTPPRTLQ
ncbi:MAG: hypothetical protein AB2L22_15900 [Syntrophales bacterium]